MWEDVHEAVDKILIEEVINDILSTLLDREKTVIICYYWLGMTYKEIGDKFQISASRISQRHSKALRKLRHETRLNEFRKLGIDWIEKVFSNREKQRLKELEVSAEANRIWEQKRREKHEQDIRNEISKRKLKIVEHDHVKPEMVVHKNERVVPYVPPCFVQLVMEPKPHLYVHPNYGSINRDLDPVTYDRWLNYLLSEKFKDHDFREIQRPRFQN